MKHTGFYFRLTAFFCVLLWCGGFSVNLITGDSNLSSVSTPLLNLIYDNVCHQDENKLFSLGGLNFLVCARCCGIYFGALITSALLLLYNGRLIIKRGIFTFICLLLFTDVTINNFVTAGYNKYTALVTGLLFGSISFLIVINISQNILTGKTID